MIAEDSNESNTDDDDGHFAQNQSISPMRALTSCCPRDSLNTTNEQDSPHPSPHPSIDKENKYQTLTAPPSPDRTVAETVESSNWSLEDGVIGRQGKGGEHTSSFGELNTLNRTMAPLTFWNAMCFFNPYDIIGACLACFGIGETQKRRIPSVGGGLSNSIHSNKDCFVRVDCSTTTGTTATRLMESDYTWNDSYYFPYAPLDQTSGSDHTMAMDDEVEKKEDIEPTPREQPQQPTQYPTSMINKLAQSLSCRMTYPPPQLRQVSNIDQKLTPISEHTKSSKYDAFTSLNTLHRRNSHFSVSFFSSETLDAIHTSPPSNTDTGGSTSTPRGDHDSGVSPPRNPLEYNTPPNRARADSETFRKTIQVVTCEKRLRDEVSPIPMDGDTPRFDNTTPRRNNEHHQSAGEQTASHKKMNSIVNLFEEEFMMFSSSTSNDQTLEEGVTAADDCYDDGAAVLLWPETYLQKSPSYIKALRKAGRKGKCLIQGWVAFRQSVSWTDIVRNPRRCDFQYVVLLDDMPLLHLFPSRPKTKKKTEPKKNVLDDCITFDLSSDIGFEIQLASQELGNEVCIVDTETGAYYCSMLPISMPNDVFQDKHKSRLARCNVLSNVFASFYQQEIVSPPPPADEYEKTVINPREYSKQMYAPQEQYDVSRHLMFVLDAAKQFPLPRR